MGKKKEPVVVPDVEVVAAGSEGNAITRVDNLVVFVPYVVPGDIIDLKIFRKKNNYAEGKAIAIKRPSPYRIEPACRHFGHCGGCKWQTTRYDVQLHFKQRQVQDTLERIGHVDTSPSAARRTRSATATRWTMRAARSAGCWRARRPTLPDAGLWDSMYL